MEQNTNNANCEMVSKWYKFYFYDDYFECYWKAGFIKKSRKVYYKDITDIACSVVTVNFIPVYSYKFTVNGQSSFELAANFKKQVENLVPAIEYIKTCRTNAIMRSIDT